ncbi:MAG: UDP-N-acetylglucosamine 2-epimerase [Nitrospirota bacterium]|nr:UDP-N-acetylglucosamine 2-epimerase [Nitrospirota bacterium]
MTRTIAVLTVGRSDFSRYRPVLRALQTRTDVVLRLLATGGHFSPIYGETWREIEAAGFKFEPGLDATLACNTPVGVGKTIALATAALAQSFARDRPDLLVLLGDRYEMLSGANAALGFNLPVVHIHGGAVTEGAIDELVRHALTKMSHYHLVSTDEYAKRVRQMGEEDWRVQTVGAPGLDELTRLAIFDRGALCAETGLDLTKGFLLLSFHPVTLELEDVETQIAALLEVVSDSPLPCVITYPNADPGSQSIIAAVNAYAQAVPAKTKVFANAGSERYTSLMANATAMIGNSSSGLVEAPTFRLPVVNIGTRQDGKIKAANIINCGYGRADIAEALQLAISNDFRDGLRDLINPYGDGRSGQRIADILATLPLNAKLLRKRFIDL